MGRWDELAGRLHISTQDGFVRKPTTADLDRFEAETGLKLPDDYREYALAFGPGQIGSFEWAFRTPGFPWADESIDLSVLNRRLRESLAGKDDADIFDWYGCDPTLVRRLVQFCSNSDFRDSFAWDPAEVTDPATSDYQIYIISGGLTPHVQKAARTFREFVMDYALGGGYERQVCGREGKAGDWAESGPIMFSQASVRVD